MNILNRGCTPGSNRSCSFLRTQRPSLYSLAPNRYPVLNPTSKLNRVQIPNATRHPASYVASLVAFAALTRTVAIDALTAAKELRILADELIPREYQDYYMHEIRKLLLNKDAEFCILIDEYQPNSSSTDQMFKAVQAYLDTKVNESGVRKINVSKNKETLAVRMNENEEIVDEFDGVEVKWRLTTKIESGERELATKRYELTFHNRHRFMILESYLPYVLERSDEIKSLETGLKLHMIDNDYPEPRTIVLDNPMTFKTLAIEPELKNSIIEDLNSFRNGKEYYRRIGKAWKRGYLIYGPSGTGKSSLIAAMANHLNYDIYDIDLTEVDSDSQLKRVLLEMPSKSLLVFDDFDRLPNPTITRLLNFMDGIWSCCGEERIFVFTTKCLDNLDPTLLRSGRIDVHIQMPYCTLAAFKQLAYSYLEVEEHRLFERIKELLEIVNVTPAEVAGELMRCTKDATISLEKLVAYLETRSSL